MNPNALFSAASQIQERFPERIEDAAAFARENRVLLIQSDNVPIDVTLGALPFEQRATERATPFEIGPGEALRTCSAEDLIVLKAFAGRARDWADIEGVALRQADALDEASIWEELLPLLHVKDDHESADRLRHVLSTCRAAPLVGQLSNPGWLKAMHKLLGAAETGAGRPVER